MASTNPQNGTRPLAFTSSPQPQLDPLRSSSKADPQDCFLSSDPTSPASSTNDLAYNDVQGYATTSTGTYRHANLPPKTSWDAASLLNPKGIRSETTKQQPLSPAGPTANGVNFESNNPVKVDFQFSNSDDVSHLPMCPPDETRNPTAHGMSSLIERMNHVQDRSSVPVAKRRKLDAGPEDGKPRTGFHGGSSGTMADYVKQKQHELQSTALAAPPQPTLDLTGGIWSLSSSGF